MESQRRRATSGRGVRGVASRTSRVAIVLLSLGLVLSCKKAPDLARSSGTAPLILISIDTLRADHLPAYGGTRIETPGLDPYFKDAVLFENCYSHCPTTLPSHTSILTGQLPFEHEVRDNIGFSLRKGQPTMAGMLQKAGFSTGGFVSTFVLRPETGIGAGFDRYDATTKRDRAEISMGELQRPGPETITAAQAWLETIRQQSPSRRFFLFLHLYEPHAPYNPPEPYLTTYAGRLYDGEIAYTDSLIGTFLDHLRELKLYDESLIILTSDHGEGLGDHGEQEHGVFLYREDIHVPLAIKYPASAYAGTRVRIPVQHIDLLPTILNFYQIDPPRGLQGKSLIGIPDGNLKREIYSESMYPLYHFGWSELYSLTDGTYQYIKSPREELYDLKADPSERENLAGKLPTTAVGYRQKVDQAVANRTVGTPAEISPDELEKLQALGYIGVASAGARGAEGKPDPKDKVHLIEKFRRGLHLHRTGDEAGAAAIFREIVEENPDMVDVLEQLGRSLARLRRVDEAVSVLRRVAELRPTNAQELMIIGRIFWKLGIPDEALQNINRALEVNPSLARGFELKGQVLYSKRDMAGALKAFDRALAIDQTLPVPYYVKGIAELQRGNLDAALLLFRRAESELAKLPSQIVLPSLHFSIGFVLAQQGQIPEAIQELSLELKGLPGNANARISLAQLLLREGRRDEAIRLFDEPHANTPEACAALSEFLRSIGETERADRLAAEGKRLVQQRATGRP